MPRVRRLKGEVAASLFLIPENLTLLKKYDIIYI